MAETVKLVCLSCGQGNRIPASRLDEGPRCGTCGAALVAGKPVETDLATLEKAARADGLPLLVDFWAPWCGPCRAMAPEFARAAQMLGSSARLAKVNTDQHPDAAIRFQIRGIPALVLFRNGREAARFAGARPAAQIVNFVRENAGTAA